MHLVFPPWTLALQGCEGSAKVARFDVKHCLGQIPLRVLLLLLVVADPAVHRVVGDPLVLLPRPCRRQMGDIFPQLLNP